MVSHPQRVRVDCTEIYGIFAGTRGCRQSAHLHNFRKIAANISLKPLQDRRSLLNIASPAARGGW